MRRLILPLVLAGILWFGLGIAVGTTPPPPAPPELKALAAALMSAPDDEARDHLLAAAPPALRDHPQLGHALNKAWGPLIYRGEYDRAQHLGDYTRHLLLSRGNTVDAAYALYLLGSIDGYRGDNQTALKKFADARLGLEAADAEDKLAAVLAGEGIVHLQLGDFQLALADTLRSLEIYRRTDYKEGVLCELDNAGTIFMDQGMTERAMEYWQQALAAAGEDQAWQVTLLHNIGNVYERRGERNQAIRLLSQSLALAEKTGDKPLVVVNLNELGNLHLQNGQLDTAAEEFHRALNFGEEVGNKRRQTVSLSGLGETLRKRGDEKSLHDALTMAERSAALARETGEPAYLWHSLALVGQLRRALHEPDQAREAFGEGIAAIEDARGHLAANDGGAAAFFEDKTDAYHGLVALLVEAGHPAEALAMAERAKARALVDILNSPKLDPTQAMTAVERATARQRTEEIASLGQQIAAAKTATPPTPAPLRAELDAKLTAARQARDDAETDFFIAHPELRNRQPPRADELGMTTAALNSLLADGKTTLLEYVVAEDESFLFTVAAAGGDPDTPPVIQAQRLPLGRAALASRTKEFRAALAERSLNWREGAKALGDDLLAPAWSACANASRLIIVPDGPLWELPFQALLVGKGESAASAGTLLEECPVSFAPSLTFLARTPAAAWTQVPRLFAVGNPALRTPAPDAVLADEASRPLPDAERQVRALAAFYGPEHSQVLVGADARETAVKQQVADGDILHFATHGILNDTAPMYSRLVLAQTDLAPDEDGFLEAWEWLPLKLHARLAVLSACETGRGRVGEGEGLLGMSWALFSAGCPSVVVSQWKVDSASDGDLMIEFHRRLLAGGSPAEALRTAGLELAKNPKYRHPFYWAPFVVVGTDRPVVATPSP